MDYNIISKAFRLSLRGSRWQSNDVTGFSAPESTFLALGAASSADCIQYNEENSSIDTTNLSSVRNFALYIAVMVFLFTISVISVYILHRQKKKQPLRKISPSLMIVSVVGNFLCIVNICFCNFFFEMFQVRQNDCIKTFSEESQIDTQKLCIKCFLESNSWFVILMDINGGMLISFSELMAILPYFIRSLRIKKMFDFREMYWETDKMPKDLIRQWCEVRVMFFFLGGLFVFGGIYMGLDRVFNVLPNYNSMGTIIEAWYPQIHVV